MTNDLLLSSDRGCISLLVLLDLSAAFNTIDHNILLNRLENFVGISGSALAWFKSYLSDCHQFVAVNEEVSYRSQVQYGVEVDRYIRLIFVIFYIYIYRHWPISVFSSADLKSGTFTGSPVLLVRWNVLLCMQGSRVRPIWSHV